MEWTVKNFWEERKLTELHKLLNKIAEFHLWMDLGNFEFRNVYYTQIQIDRYLKLLPKVKKLWARYPRVSEIKWNNYRRLNNEIIR